MGDSDDDSAADSDKGADGGPEAAVASQGKLAPDSDKGAAGGPDAAAASEGKDAQADIDGSDPPAADPPSADNQDKSDAVAKSAAKASAPATGDAEATASEEPPKEGMALHGLHAVEDEAAAIGGAVSNFFHWGKK